MKNAGVWIFFFHLKKLWSQQSHYHRSKFLFFFLHSLLPESMTWSENFLNFSDLSFSKKSFQKKKKKWIFFFFHPQMSRQWLLIGVTCFFFVEKYNNKAKQQQQQQQKKIIKVSFGQITWWCGWIFLYYHLSSIIIMIIVIIIITEWPWSRFVITNFLLMIKNNDDGTADNRIMGKPIFFFFLFSPVILICR